MRYGHFDNHTREYVITNPKTPVKWINYIGTLAFGGFVDHTGGALLCKGDPTENRITKYLQQAPAGEFKGSTLYLVVRDGKGARVVTPYFVPQCEPCDRYECRMGLGYIRTVSEIEGLRTDATIFVPADETPVELRDVTITNTRNTVAGIDAVPVVEYTHPMAVMQFTNADWVPQTMMSRAVDIGDGIRFLAQYPFMHAGARMNFFASAPAFSSFDSDRKLFLGDNEYGGWRRPLSLLRDALSCSEAHRGDNIGALMLHLGEIGPGESRRFVTMLGQETSQEGCAAIVRRFSDPSAVEAAYHELERWWARNIETIQVSTPDPDFDGMVNVHNPRQCHVTGSWSRYLSYYQLGLGSRGIGFRDSLQDLMGIVEREPRKARALLLRLLSMQRVDGAATHQYNPLTLQRSQGDAAERPDRPQYYGDDHLWLIPVVCAYVKETGEWALLDETVPFVDEAGEAVNPNASVLEHLRRALSFTKRDVGKHGLPLLGFADWNDTVNLASGAESMFVACLYGLGLREMAHLCRTLGMYEEAEQYRRDHGAMAELVNGCAWDGEWYVRYFDADGSPIGSRNNTHGRIYLNAQTWPVLAGFAPREWAFAGMDAARAHLNTAHGIKLSTPGYDHFDPAIGGVTTYPPGAKENGGIFLHTNPWAIIAETMLGRGDRAYEYYAQTNPAAKNDHIDTYECEPYVYAQNVLGDEHPQFGLARNSWLSGTSSWMYQAAVKHILGIRADYDGLIVDPCIPSHWGRFNVQRSYRGCRYEIDVENPEHVCSGVASLEVDGERVEGTKVPLVDGRKVCRVRAVLG
ncbi:MAG: glycosyl transferase [Chitinivibrionales bacterium]|nr:glycosyl transferase [Chitinivibrionales bacterium]